MLVLVLEERWNGIVDLLVPVSIAEAFSFGIQRQIVMEL